MLIEWDKIELEDDADKAALSTLLKNKKFTGYVDTAVQNRVTAAEDPLKSKASELKTKLDEFRGTNVDLVQKLEKLSAVDLDEYNRLKKLGGDAQQNAKLLKDMETSHAAVVNGYKKKEDEWKSEKESLISKNNSALHTFDGHKGISEWAATSKDISIAAGADDMLLQQILTHSSYDPATKKTVLKNPDGTDFTTDSGMGSIKDWISTVGRKNWPFMFESPEGSGALGNRGGANGKSITRADWDKISDPARKAEVAKTFTITD